MPFELPSGSFSLLDVQCVAFKRYIKRNGSSVPSYDYYVFFTLE